MEETRKAIEILKNGGIVIFPTDTAFGIGCRIDNKEAIKRLFKIRKRPISKAAPVLVDSLKMAQNYLFPIPQDVIDQLIKPYWPGALTIILRCKRVKVPSLVRGGGETLGIRIPKNKIIQTIISEVGKPILGPSANFSGEKTPYSFEELDKGLVKLADYVIKGECQLKQQSTVIDCSKKPWKVVRDGAVKLKLFDMNTILLIDTSSNKEIVIGLRIDSKQHWIKQKVGLKKAQVVLSMIDNLLVKYSLGLRDIKSIEVNAKHGSFTGVRVGLSVANALSFALKIPVEKT